MQVNVEEVNRNHSSELEEVDPSQHGVDHSAGAVGVARPDAIKTAAKQDNGCCSLSTVIANLPGGSALALALMCGGIILLVTGFFLTRQELDSYVKQHQQPKTNNVTFDAIFPGLLYWIVGLAAGFLAYGLFHCVINVMVNVRVNRSRKPLTVVKPGVCLRIIIIIIYMIDTILIAAVGLMACAAFLPLYAQAMFASKLASGESQFDLQHYVATRMANGASLTVESQSSTDGSVGASSFPMFYPSLALFFGVCFIEISLMMLLIFLATGQAQLISSIQNARRIRSSRNFQKGSPTNSSGIDTQL